MWPSSLYNPRIRLRSPYSRYYSIQASVCRTRQYVMTLPKQALDDHASYQYSLRQPFQGPTLPWKIV